MGVFVCVHLYVVAWGLPDVWALCGRCAVCVWPGPAVTPPPPSIHLPVLLTSYVFIGKKRGTRKEGAAKETANPPSARGSVEEAEQAAEACAEEAGAHGAHGSGSGEKRWVHTYTCVCCAYVYVCVLWAGAVTV